MWIERDQSQKDDHQSLTKAPHTGRERAEIVHRLLILRQEPVHLEMLDAYKKEERRRANPINTLTHTVFSF